MKYLVLLFIFISFLSSHSQNKSDIQRLNSESKIVGEQAYPMLYRFKANELILNGAGMRKVHWTNGYSCALYLENPETDSKRILNKDEVMMIRLDIISKKIDHKKIVEAFENGIIETNSEIYLSNLKSEIELFIEYLEDLTLGVGDKIDIVYEPYKGISLNVNYKKKGAISGYEFKKALFNIWLAEKPVDKDLKVALLDGAKGYVY